MATFFQIDDLPPFTGKHPLDISYFTNRELHTIKRLAGIRAGELEEAFEAGDTDLILAFAVIALERNGIQVGKQAEEELWNAPLGKMQLVIEEDEPAEDDAGPPAIPNSSGETLSGGDENKPSSGVVSNGDGASPENDPSPTGSPGLDTGSPVSGHAT